MTLIAFDVAWMTVEAAIAIAGAIALRIAYRLSLVAIHRERIRRSDALERDALDLHLDLAQVRISYELRKEQ